MSFFGDEENLLGSLDRGQDVGRWSRVLRCVSHSVDKIFQGARQAGHFLNEVGNHLIFVSVHIHPKQDHAVDRFPIHRDSRAHVRFILAGADGTSECSLPISQVIVSPPL
jgi:hypothetical protein